jgi:1-deoxy-D-xylulose-5-phosphate reductoisomerase
VAHLDFRAPDLKRFPCLRLAVEAMEAGGTTPAVLNAANEVAVEAFLERKIRFTDIPAVIENTLSAVPRRAAETLAEILESDEAARDIASLLVRRAA